MLHLTHIMRPTALSGAKVISCTQVALLFLFLSLIITVFPGFTNDVGAYQRWCLHIQQRGLSHAYETDTDYMPLIHYLLWLFGKIAHSETLVRNFFYYFRSLVLIFDFGAICLLWRWAGLQLRLIHLLFYCLVLNVAMLYNTVIWGQVDAIGAALVFGALYAASVRRLLLSTALCVLAVNMKLQMIVFVPVWGMICLYHIAAQRKWWQLPVIPLTAAGLQCLLLLPFSNGPSGIGGALQVPLHNVGEMPWISIHAHNLWQLIFGDASRELRDDRIVLWGMTYRQTGFLLFFITSAAALVPLGKSLWRNLRCHSPGMPDRALVWRTAALVALLFFYCNTEMHDRYAHPALIFLAALAFYTSDYTVWAICSFAYFWNLELYMHAFRWPNFIYDSPLLGGYAGGVLFGIVILMLYRQLYVRRSVSVQ